MLNTYGILQQVIFRPLGGVVMAHFGDLVGRKKIVFAFYFADGAAYPVYRDIAYL